MGMRFRELVTEGWRNTICGASRAAVVGLALSLTGVALLVADAVSVQAAIAEAASYRQAGAAIKTVEAPDAIDAAACERISSLSGVRAGGAIRRLDSPLAALALPGSTLPASEVTPSFARLLGISEAGEGVLVSRSVANRLGVEAGDELLLTTGTARVLGVFDWPDDGRRAGLGYTVLIPTVTAKVFDECWAESWPESRHLPELLRSTTIPEHLDPASPPDVGSVNESLGTRFEGGERFAARITRFSPFLGLITAGLIAMIATRARRLEIAAAQHFGVRRRDAAAIALVETVAALAPAAVVTLAAAGVVGQFTPSESDAVMGIGLRVTAGLTAGSMIGTISATWSIRPGRLLSYFKNR